MRTRCVCSLTLANFVLPLYDIDSGPTLTLIAPVKLCSSVKLDQEIIREVRFKGDGCAASRTYRSSLYPQINGSLKFA